MKTQSVLYGNGFNLLSGKKLSWKDLLNEIAQEKIDNDIPITLQYESVILKQPYRDKVNSSNNTNGALSSKNGNNTSNYSARVFETGLKHDIAERVKEFTPNKAYERLAKLPVEHFMTTNYDNTLKKVGGCSFGTKHFKEKLYSIERYIEIKTNDGNKKYWPIHGNVEAEYSIMLGFDQYCGSLSRIERYVNGNLELIKNKNRVDSIARKLKDYQENKVIKPFDSWIDLFFFSDVHIIGLDLRYEEMDLWWIINRRRRMRRKGSVTIDNHIYYYPVAEISKDKIDLLKGSDVEVVELNDKGTYLQRYNTQFDEMIKRMSVNGVV